MFASSSIFIPRMVPSRLTASWMSWIWSRPWWVATMFSLRDSVHFTGLPSFWHSTTARISSR